MVRGRLAVDIRSRGVPERGARKVFATVTHGPFLAGSEAVVANPDLEGIVVADRSLPFGSAQALPARS